MSTKRHIILGFPGSGKTTYLAALWYALDAEIPDISLRLEEISGDKTYLNEIMRTWLKCQEVLRTTISGEEKVDILVRDTQTQKIAHLILPDFSGETFQSICADRQCDQLFAQNFDHDGGILFFINAERCNDMLNVLDHVHEEETTESDFDRQIEIFDPRKVPEQTKIVDVLQLLSDHPFYPQRRRLMVAISAWDVVIDDDIAPEEWIRREMPLLYQFLKNREATFEIGFCGISAQGGIFTTNARDKLLEIPPHERMICEWNGVRGSDITRPLAWLDSNGS